LSISAVVCMANATGGKRQPKLSKSSKIRQINRYAGFAQKSHLEEKNRFKAGAGSGSGVSRGAGAHHAGRRSTGGGRTGARSPRGVRRAGGNHHGYAQTHRNHRSNGGESKPVLYDKDWNTRGPHRTRNRESLPHKQVLRDLPAQARGKGG